MPPIQNLNIASSSPIIASLSNLKSLFNSINGWQNPSNNKYIINTHEVIKNDFRSGSINNIELVNYLSSSITIHCLNGWSYLSSAINSLLEGDYGNAIHNAYYAELRGIISILASQGIGVFNGTNVVIDSSNIVHEILPRGIPTHAFAKQAFDEWLKEPTNSNKIFENIIIENASLKDWIDATGFSTYTASQLASDKLRDWSLDLTVIETEQKFRNFVSYNPQNFDLSLSWTADNIQDRLRFVSNLWQLCAPNGNFSNSILRMTLESMYSSLFGLSLSGLNPELRQILIDLGKDPNDYRSQYIINYLSRQIQPTNNIVFDYANSIRHSTPILESDTDPFGIISRACLILMINNKILESTFSQSGVSKNDLNFWHNNIGLRLGYWSMGQEPTLLSDLWEDVEIEIDDIESWITNSSPNLNQFDYKIDLRNSINHIRSLGKVCLWNLGLE